MTREFMEEQSIYGEHNNIYACMQELYKSILGNEDFVEERFQKICAWNGIGPKKLARCRRKGKAACFNIVIMNGVSKIGYVIRYMISIACKVPVCFSMVDISGTTITEADESQLPVILDLMVISIVGKFWSWLRWR